MRATIPSALMVVVAASLIVPSDGYATPPLRPVQDVNVVNEVPVVEQIRGYVSHQLVGITSVETEANIGLGGMTMLCQAEIPDSRICTTREIVESVDPIPPVTSISWVLGEYEVIPNSTSTTFPFFWREKVSGNGDLADSVVALHLGCDQMLGAASSFRTVVYGGSSGVFFRTSCSGMRPVACCAPRFVQAGP